MLKIRIKNFGPINEGFQENGGWMDVSKITLLIGNQGSGKSTVAKLISTFSWIEKALVRGDFKESEFRQYNRLKKQFVYQNIINYFRENTEIEYQGYAYHISLIDGKTTVKKSPNNGYLFPKIMFSDRHFKMRLSIMGYPNL